MTMCVVNGQKFEMFRDVVNHFWAQDGVTWVDWEVTDTGWNVAVETNEKMAVHEVSKVAWW